MRFPFSPPVDDSGTPVPTGVTAPVDGGGLLSSIGREIAAPYVPPVPGMVNPANNDPHALASQLLRAQFDEWVNSFKPIELNAMKQVSFNNPSVLPKAIEKATSAATGQADTMRGVLDRSNTSMGIVPTAGQERASTRILNLDRATAVAGAANKARENVRMQDEQILLGGVPNMNIVKGTIQ